jgi:hypothetical protein
MSMKIFITCPETEFSVWTGFRAPRGTGLAGLKTVTLRRCSECGESHTWDANGAYWRERSPRPVSSWTKFTNILQRSGRSS